MACARTGRPSISPWSDSQLSAPMVGKMRDATCNIERRYKSATSTGLGRVFVMKFTSVCKCGRIFESRGAL